MTKITFDHDLDTYEKNHEYKYKHTQPTEFKGFAHYSNGALFNSALSNYFHIFSLTGRWKYENFWFIFFFHLFIINFPGKHISPAAKWEQMKADNETNFTPSDHFEFRNNIVTIWNMKYLRMEIIWNTWEFHLRYFNDEPNIE